MTPHLPAAPAQHECFAPRYLLAPVPTAGHRPHIGPRCTAGEGQTVRADWGCARAIRPVRLSATQRRLYEFVRGYQDTWGHTPSYREIARACGFSSDSTVSYHVGRFVKLKLMRKPRRRVRAIILTAVPVKLG